MDGRLAIISGIKSYTCLLTDLSTRKKKTRRREGEFQEGKMKTQVAALSSDAVCNLATGSASLPFSEPVLFRKSCDLPWRSACQFLCRSSSLWNRFFIRESQLLNCREGIKNSEAVLPPKAQVLFNQVRGFSWVTALGFVFHLCCLVVVFLHPSPDCIRSFYLFFIIKQGRDRYRSSVLSSRRGVCTSARLSFSSRFSIKPRRPLWMPVLIRPVSCRVGLGAWKRQLASPERSRCSLACGKES